MAKTISTDLHQLIYSLGTGELIYFKKYAKRYCEKESVYLTLFDSIKATENNIEMFDGGKLNMCNKQRFAEHKWYLYNLILESLTAYHKNNRLDFQVRDMISKGIILMNKKLFNQALKIIEQAKELIQKNNLNYVGNEVLALEGTIKMEIFKEPNMVNYFKSLFTACRKNTQQMDNLTNLLEVRYVAKSLYCKYGILAHIVDKETLTYCEEKLTEINRNELTPIELIIYDSNTVNLYALGKPETQYHAVFMRLKEMYDKNKCFIQQHTHNYLYMIANSISRYIIFNNLVEANKNLNILKEINKSNGLFSERYFSALIDTNIFYYELILLLKNKNYEIALEKIKIIHYSFIRNIETLPTRIQLRNFYLFGQIFFYNKQYECALDWFIKIFVYSTSRLDLQLLARMYEIACHVELKNYFLVSHKLVALNRFYKKELSSILQVKTFIKIIKQFINTIVVYKNHGNKNRLETQLISLSKMEHIDEFGFDIVIYCIMKNNLLNFSEAINYYNTNLNTK